MTIQGNCEVATQCKKTNLSKNGGYNKLYTQDEGRKLSSRESEPLNVSFRFTRDEVDPKPQVLLRPRSSGISRNFRNKSHSPRSPNFRVSSPQIRRPQTAYPRLNLRRRSSEFDSKARKNIEKWIPQDIRIDMVRRDLQIVKEAQASKERRSISTQRNLKSCSLDALERCKSREKFGIEQRKKCGLCDRLYLMENLILAVTLKACLDMRKSWGNKYDPEGSVRIKTNPNLTKPPACYNQTRVCAFCAQLFDNQDVYRPSCKAKEEAKRRASFEEEQLQRKIANDPLAYST